MNKELKRIIESDCFRYYGNEKRPFLYKTRTKNLRYIICLRKASFYNDKRDIRKYYYKIKLRLMEKNSNFDISINAKIGEGLYIAHKGTLVISPYASLGKNIYFSASATVGMQNRGKNKGAPNIGDCVWIGANAVIVGNVKIGDNVLIAPNAYVNFDVPDNSIVIGCPGVIKESKDATSGYIQNKV